MTFKHDLALDLAASDKNTWNRFGTDSDLVRNAKKRAVRMRSAARTIQRTVRTAFPRLAGRYRALTKDEILGQLPPRPFIDREELGRVPVTGRDDLPGDYDYYIWKNPKTMYGRNARSLTYGMLKALVPERSSVRVHYLALYGYRYPDKDREATFQKGRTTFVRHGLQTVTIRRMKSNDRDVYELTCGGTRAALYMDDREDDDDITMPNFHAHEPYLIVFSTTILGQPIVKSHSIWQNSMSMSW